MILIAAILGACLYRWRGHASKYKKYFPRPFNQIAFALPYALVALHAPWFVVLAVLIATTCAILTGHGNFFNNKTYGKDPETTEFVILWLKPHIPLKLYKFIGMSITGLVITLPSGIATLNPLLAVSGVLKGVAYFTTKTTEQGEYLTGALLWGSLAYIVWGVLG